MDNELEELRKRRAASLQKEIERAKEWPDSPVEVNDDGFRELVTGYPLIVVDMWAPWCSPCRMLAPILEELSSEMKGKVLFAKMNVDDNPKTSRMFKVMSIPTLLIIKDRELVDRVNGVVPKKTLVQRLERFVHD